tara:strand:+ start:1153 stop:1437 length:285 start_codon:yes stop_codon:yes gene_type:complete
MSLSKQIITDKIETCRVLDHYVLQVRDAIQVLENNEVISQKYKRYVLNPDADVTAISDPVVLAQFNVVMTDEIKANYQTFLASQEPVVTEESSE